MVLSGYGSSLGFGDVFKEAGDLDKTYTSPGFPRVFAVGEIAGQYQDSRIVDKGEGTAPISEAHRKMGSRDSTATRFILGGQMPPKMNGLLFMFEKTWPNWNWYSLAYLALQSTHHL